MIQEDLQRKIDAINAGVQQKNDAAVQLLGYLSRQREIAAAEEEVAEEDLKKRGIIIGQHIPSLKTKLDVDPTVIGSFGDLANNVVIAKDLLDQNHTSFLRRTGNLPISEVAEAKKIANEKAMANVPKDVPHYVFKNETTKNRETRVSVRFEETFKTREMERTKKMEAIAASGILSNIQQKKKFPKKKILSAEQRIENETVLKKMNHKLNYLRNPRNDPAACTKMLVKSKAAFQEGASIVGGGNSNTQAAVQMDAATLGSAGAATKAAALAAMGNTAAGAGGKKKKQTGALSKQGPIQDNPLFVCSPKVVTFANFELGKKYKQILTFRNVSAVTRSIRVLQPTHSLFTLSQLKYPANCNDGMVAPGISVSAVLHFVPESLGDFADSVRVETESGNFDVHIYASRDPPMLSLPSIIDIGNCLVGDAMRVNIDCVNTGGSASFFMYRHDQVLGEPTDQELYDRFAGMGCMRMDPAPFTIYPTQFALATNESISLSIEFVPLKIGEVDCSFTVKYDTGQSRTFTIKGTAKELAVKARDINGVAFDSGDGRVFQEMVFPSANVGTEHSQEITVVNNTGLPVEFEWVWIDPAVVSDLNSEGRRIIRDREKQDRLKMAADAAGGEDDFGAAVSGALGDSALDGGLPMAVEDTFQLGGSLLGTRVNEEGDENSTDPGGICRVQSRDPGKSGGAGVAGAGGAGAGANTGIVPAAAHNTETSNMELLKSIKMGDSKTFANLAARGEFELYPARGVIGVGDSLEGSSPLTRGNHRGSSASFDSHEGGDAAGGNMPSNVEKFKITFTPSKLTTSRLQAVLMIKSSPLPAYPAPDQRKLLQNLAMRGHGRFYRLKSWLEEIGTPSLVDEFVTPQGEFSNTKILIDMQTLLHLVHSQALEPANYKDIARLQLWCSRMLKHVYSLRRKEALADDGSVSVNDADISDGEEGEDESVRTVNATQIHPFDWIPDETPTATECFPIKLLNKIPLSLLATTALPRSAATVDSGREGGRDGGEGSVGSLEGDESLGGGDGSPSRIGEEYRDDDGDVNAEGEINSQGRGKTNNNNNNRQNDRGNNRERDLESTDGGLSLEGGGGGEGMQMPPPNLATMQLFAGVEMNEVWFDVKSCLQLMGNSVCSTLDLKVKHEAVEYLKAGALTSVASVCLPVQGEGKQQMVAIVPPILVVGGRLSIGKTWTGMVRLRNLSPALAELIADMNAFTVQKLYSPQSTDVLEDHDSISLWHEGELKNHIRLELSQERVLIMPNEEVSFNVSLTVDKIGMYEVILPFSPLNEFTHVDKLRIVVNVFGPHIRFETAELDLGLIGVGYDTTKTLHFANESDIPAMFLFKPSLQLDNMAGVVGGKSILGSNLGGGASSNALSRQGTQRDGLTSNTLSRQSTFRSEDGFSIMDSSRSSTQGDFKIELSNAAVTVDPPSGIVGPRQSMSVTVNCKAGKTPQRIRGMLEGRIFDFSGEIEVLSQYLNLRGEVQAPKTMMYPMMNNLGQVFVGMPVKFYITIENLCNLPTKYKLMRPGGESTLFRIKFDQYKGELSAKEKLRVECTFTALVPGMVDDVISNKIFGAKYPLGFSVRAIAKGIQLDFCNLGEGDVPPAPLATADDTQFHGGEKAPEPSPIEPIHLGNDVALYERRSMRFAIRNLSAIPVPFTIAPRIFKVIERMKRFPSHRSVAASQQSAGRADGEKDGAGASSISGGPSGLLSNASGAALPVERKDLILAPHESSTDKFKSKKGKEYIGETVQRQEDRKFLQSGLGASYWVDTPSGAIPPWGVVVVTLRAFNDIPGNYSDDIEVKITEGEVQRSFLIPVHMRIKGCPIVIMRDTLGMSMVTKGAEDRLGEQILLMGHSTLKCPPLVRYFVVKNNGSKVGKIRWSVRGISAEKRGPLRLSFSLSDVGKMSPRLNFWIDIEKNTPYSIEPIEAEIPPYGRKRFTVSMPETDKRGKLEAKFTGKVIFSDDKSISFTQKEIDGDEDDEDEEQGGNAKRLHDTLANQLAPRFGASSDSSGSSNLVVGAVALAGGIPLPPIAEEGKPSHSKHHHLNHHVVINDPATEPKAAGNPAAIAIPSPGAHPSSSNPSLSSINRFQLTLIASAEFSYPQLIMDKHTLIAEGTPTIMSEETQITMKAFATTLFASGVRPADVCQRNVTLINPMDTQLVFSASVDGPFVILGDKDDTSARLYGSVMDGNASTSTIMSNSTVGGAGEGAERGERHSHGGGKKASGKSFLLLPQASANFVVAFNPRKNVRERLLKMLGDSGGKPTEQSGRLQISFSTGQSLHIPLVTQIRTPFLSGSSPRMYFGVCHVLKGATEGILLLSNPSDVPAFWRVEHVEGGGAWRKSTAIRVRGFEPTAEEVDDPSVFQVTPDAGSVTGPTLSVASAVAAPPKDYNRKADTVVAQHLTETSWAKNQLSMTDTLKRRHDEQGATPAEACYPLPLTVRFAPKKNAHYSSRFRFYCQLGNTFDVVLQGEGTYEEHLHKPLSPQPR